MTTVSIIISVVFALRLGTLVFSIQNEKRLKQEGAVEYGQRNSAMMAILHTVFYLVALTYAIVNRSPFDTLAVFGFILYAFSFIMLLTVICQLRKIWTVKLIIAKDHPLNRNFLFKYIRHPNYFLNIIPELIALMLLSKAWAILGAIFPFYLVTVVLRIREEEKVMKEKFAEY
ncbi:MAG: DUF1295 domain-containing protein [Firmicutes bacterium]|nr:DUF1295 domain-containing protein [Bacillota bacterium]